MKKLADANDDNKSNSLALSRYLKSDHKISDDIQINTQLYTMKKM